MGNTEYKQNYEETGKQNDIGGESKNNLQVNRREEEKKQIEIVILDNKEYFDQHPEELDKLVLCYRDIFGHSGIKKENAGTTEWGEYLRCKKCNKGISIEQVFPKVENVKLADLDESNILETAKCPDCKEEVEFWHNPEILKDMIKSLLNEEINKELETETEDVKKENYKYSYCALLKNKEEVVGFLVGTTRTKDKAIEELQFHLRQGSGREVRANKTEPKLKDEKELELLRIIKGFNKNEKTPNYADIENIMYVAEMGLSPELRSPENVKEMSQKFFEGFSQKLKGKGIECHDIIQWTARYSRIYNILIGQRGEEIFDFNYGDLVIVWNNLDYMLESFKKSTVRFWRDIFTNYKKDMVPLKTIL